METNEYVGNICEMHKSIHCGQLRDVQISKRNQIADIPLTIGILSLQGDFERHKLIFQSLNLPLLTIREIKIAADVKEIDILVIPGGESTTMCSILKMNHFLGDLEDQTSLLLELKDFVLVKKKPVWGTCAGCILLAEKISGTSEPGCIGGIRIEVSRNWFGRQNQSFEAQVNVSSMELSEISGKTINAAFIRAPIIRSLSPKVKELAHIVYNGEKVPTAAMDGNVIVSTFHPELTGDLSLHIFVLKRASKSIKKPLSTID